MAIISSATAKFINCQFYNNKANWANGGAVTTTATSW